MRVQSGDLLSRAGDLLLQAAEGVQRIADSLAKIAADKCGLLATESRIVKGKKDPPSPFDDDPDPEIREAWLQVQADRKAGRLKKPPRRAIDCHSLEDLCRYIFKLAYLDGSYQMLKTDAGIERWVWFGHEFGDRLVSVVEQMAPRIPNRHELIELRLVATRVSANGVQRLRRAFPTTMVSVYSDEAHDKNWELSQAAYTPG